MITKEDLHPTHINTLYTLGAASAANFVAGGVPSAAGVIVVLTAPRAKPESVGVSPLVGPGLVGIEGRF